MRRARLACCVAIAAAGLAGIPALLVAAPGVPAARPTGSSGSQLLPDLDVVAPYELGARVVSSSGERRVLLAFASAAMNVGRGPLVVHGSRESRADPVMAATQVISLAGGGETSRPDVGQLEYVVDETHEHWHLRPFMRYELRRASDFQLVAPDQKSGFCLGDRADAFPGGRLPGEPDQPVFATNCGLRQPDLLGLVEGISVGWKDPYEAWRDQQYIDVTGLAAGTYVLVHRVNVGRVLAESRYANNAASVLLRITWPNGRLDVPRLKVLARCAQVARCQR
jgi:hypothetical protein